MKSELDIIYETYIEYMIKKSPRGTKTYVLNDIETDGCCYYNTETGAKCAVGRCLEHPEAFADTIGVITDRRELLDDLKPEYKGHRIGFWDKLQRLHDTWMVKDCPMFHVQLYNFVNPLPSKDMVVVDAWFKTFHQEALRRYENEIASNRRDSGVLLNPE
jgi:hypothetical protein